MMDNEETRKFENDSGISFPVTRTEHSQAQQDHERKQATHQDVHGENQNTFEHVKVKVPPKPCDPTKEERQSHEATQSPFRACCEVCVKAKNPGGKHTEQLGNTEHVLVIEFECASATDTPGDPNKKMSMMVAADSIHGSIFAVVASELEREPETLSPIVQHDETRPNESKSTRTQCIY